MSVSGRLGRLGDRVFDRLRDERAFAVTDDDAVDAGFESLRGHKYVVLVTFRRNGDAVPSPVWFAVNGNGDLFVKTRHDAGKVTRLRNDSRALVAPSNARGRPTGPAIRATGRVLPREEWAYAEDALRAEYGSGRRVSEWVLSGPEEEAAYIEVRPGR